MKRRTFLRTAGVLGAAGMAGCATPFDSFSVPESNGDETPTPELTPTPEPPETRSGAALTGVYPGGPGANLISNLETYSTWVSQPPAVAMVFVDALVSKDAIEGFIEGALTDIWDAGHVPMLSWQPFLKQKDETPEIIERQIAHGKYDETIKTWANLLAKWARPRGGKTRGRRFYFRPAHEMNGTWFPWSATTADANPSDAPGPDPTAGTPKEYVEMWRRMHDFFGETKLDESHIQWIWAPNVDEVGGIATERYYPGDEYVDWVGLDGFNFGGTENYSGWAMPEELYGKRLSEVRELTSKPVALTEFASSSFVPADDGDENKTDGHYQPEQKAAWIAAVFEYIKNENIKMACWFNQDKTGDDESDWAVLGSRHGTAQATIDGETYNTYPEYKQTVNSPEFLSALTDYPPLLTDDEFAGNF